MKTYPYDVFLSHNSQDKPAVKWLAAKLADEAGLRVFLDSWNLIPGDPWQEELEQALEESQTVAVFLGPAGISGWHNEELREALNQRVREPERRVIPILLPGTTMPEEGEIPSFLTRLTWVDFRKGLEDEEAFRILVAGIQGKEPGRGKDAKVPKPPPQPPETAQPKEEKTESGTESRSERVSRVEAKGERSVAIGGSANGAVIITGNDNVVGSTVNLQEEYRQQIYEAIEGRENTSSYEKDDLKEKIARIQEEDAKGDSADKGFIAHQLENLKKMAPDILEVVLATITNPLAGFGVAARKIAEKMKSEAS